LSNGLCRAAVTDAEWPGIYVGDMKPTARAGDDQPGTKATSLALDVESGCCARIA